MLRLLRVLVGLTGLVVVVLFAIANRQPVDVSFWPLPVTVDLPLYGVLLVGLVLGVGLTALVASVEILRLRMRCRRLERRLRGFEYQARMAAEREEEAEVARTRARGRELALSAPGG